MKYLVDFKHSRLGFAVGAMLGAVALASLVFTLLHRSANRDQTEHLTAEAQSNLKIEMERTYQGLLSRMKTSDQALLEESQASWSENLLKYQSMLICTQI